MLLEVGTGRLEIVGDFANANPMLVSISDSTDTYFVNTLIYRNTAFIVSDQFTTSISSPENDFCIVEGTRIEYFPVQ